MTAVEEEQERQRVREKQQEGRPRRAREDEIEDSLSLSLRGGRSAGYFMGSLSPHCRFISHYLSAKAG